MKKNILLIGSGGREHALAWKIKQSPSCGELFTVPGNAGTALLGENVPIDAKDISAIIAFAQERVIDLVVVAPDDPLALGLVDALADAGIRAWGPTALAAQLESSKAFAKEVMVSAGIPTAQYETFSDFESAWAYAEKLPTPIVVKASGLALGKGVVIAQTHDEAREALHNILVEKIFGEMPVVIEEFLTGPEVSFHAFCDGKHFVMLPSSQDHKRIGEGNTGLNTGGMGTIAPVPFVGPELVNEVATKVVAPLLAEMNKRGMPFKGLLYPGVMLTPNGLRVLEFNARFGDPETQVYMRLLESDIVEIFEASIDGTLDTLSIQWKPGFAVNIVLASGGYPQIYEKGKVITGIDEAEKLDSVVVFHAGTKNVEDPERSRRTGNALVTNGGRVLGVSATGATFAEAKARAYEACEKIDFEGKYQRNDIGQSALETPKTV
jgi:phosphoribosylamine--glycine ligase